MSSNVHPPVFYAILHLACTLTRSIFSIGQEVNILFSRNDPSDSVRQPGHKSGGNLTSMELSGYISLRGHPEALLNRIREL